MLKTIADTAIWEVRFAIKFLNANNCNPAEIHRQLVDIYGEHAMTDGMFRRYVRQFNDGSTNFYDEPPRGPIF